MALRSILLKSGQTKLWLNSSAVVYIVYLFIYITRDKIYSSAVCFTKNDANRTCQCVNNNSTAVQCLLTNISNPSCQLMARESYKYFCEVMSQFNCETMYSVKWNCTDCLGAYTNWLLAVFNPHSSTSWLSNCTGMDVTKQCPSQIIVSFCKQVLAKCPYFSSQNSYGDTPAFECPLDSSTQPWTNCSTTTIDST